MRKEMETETATIVQTVHGMCVIVDRTALLQLLLQARIQPTFQHTPPATLPSVCVCVCVCVCGMGKSAWITSTVKIAF